MESSETDTTSDEIQQPSVSLPVDPDNKDALQQSPEVTGSPSSGDDEATTLVDGSIHVEPEEGESSDTDTTNDDDDREKQALRSTSDERQTPSYPSDVSLSNANITRGVEDDDISQRTQSSRRSSSSHPTHKAQEQESLFDQGYESSDTDTTTTQGPEYHSQSNQPDDDSVAFESSETDTTSDEIQQPSTSLPVDPGNEEALRQSPEVTGIPSSGDREATTLVDYSLLFEAQDGESSDTDTTNDDDREKQAPRSTSNDWQTPSFPSDVSLSNANITRGVEDHEMSQRTQSSQTSSSSDPTQNAHEHESLIDQGYESSDTDTTTTQGPEHHSHSKPPDEDSVAFESSETDTTSDEIQQPSMPLPVNPDKEEALRDSPKVTSSQLSQSSQSTQSMWLRKSRKSTRREPSSRRLLQRSQSSSSHGADNSSNTSLRDHSLPDDELDDQSRRSGGVNAMPLQDRMQGDRESPQSARQSRVSRRSITSRPSRVYQSPISGSSREAQASDADKTKSGKIDPDGHRTLTQTLSLDYEEPWPMEIMASVSSRGELVGTAGTNFVSPTGEVAEFDGNPFDSEPIATPGLDASQSTDMRNQLMEPNSIISNASPVGSLSSRSGSIRSTSRVISLLGIDNRTVGEASMELVDIFGASRLGLQESSIGLQDVFETPTNQPSGTTERSPKSKQQAKLDHSSYPAPVDDELQQTTSFGVFAIPEDSEVDGESQFSTESSSIRPPDPIGNAASHQTMDGTHASERQFHSGQAGPRDPSPSSNMSRASSKPSSGSTWKTQLSSVNEKSIFESEVEDDTSGNETYYSEQLDWRHRASASGTSSSQISTPDDTRTSQLSTPYDTSSSPISIPNGTRTSQLSASYSTSSSPTSTSSSKGTSSSQISTPNGTSSSQISKPNGTSSSHLSAPYGTSSSSMSTPSGLTPSGTGSSQMSTPDGTSSFQISTSNTVESPRSATKPSSFYGENSTASFIYHEDSDRKPTGILRSALDEVYVDESPRSDNWGDVETSPDSGPHDMSRSTATASRSTSSKALQSSNYNSSQSSSTVDDDFGDKSRNQSQSSSKRHADIRHPSSHSSQTFSGHSSKGSDEYSPRSEDVSRHSLSFRFGADSSHGQPRERTQQRHQSHSRHGDTGTPSRRRRSTHSRSPVQSGSSRKRRSTHSSVPVHSTPSRSSKSSQPGRGTHSLQLLPEELLRSLERSHTTQDTRLPSSKDVSSRQVRHEKQASEIHDVSARSRRIAASPGPSVGPRIRTSASSSSTLGVVASQVDSSNYEIDPDRPVSFVEAKPSSTMSSQFSGESTWSTPKQVSQHEILGFLRTLDKSMDASGEGTKGPEKKHGMRPTNSPRSVDNHTKTESTKTPSKKPTATTMRRVKEKGLIPASGRATSASPSANPPIRELHVPDLVVKGLGSFSVSTDHSETNVQDVTKKRTGSNQPSGDVRIPSPSVLVATRSSPNLTHSNLPVSRPLAVLRDMSVPFRPDLTNLYCSINNEGFLEAVETAYLLLLELRPRLRYLFSLSEWIHVHALMLYCRVFDCELAALGITAAGSPHFRIELPQDLLMLEPLAAVLESIGIVEDVSKGVRYIPVAKPRIFGEEQDSKQRPPGHEWQRRHGQEWPEDVEIGRRDDIASTSNRQKPYLRPDPEDVTEFLEWTQYPWHTSWIKVEQAREARQVMSLADGILLPSKSFPVNHAKLLEWEELALEKWLGWDESLWFAYGQTVHILRNKMCFVPFPKKSTMGTYSWLLPRRVVQKKIECTNSKSSNNLVVVCRLPNPELPPEVWMMALLFNLSGVPPEDQHRLEWYYETVPMKGISNRMLAFLGSALVEA